MELTRDCNASVRNVSADCVKIGVACWRLRTRSISCGSAIRSQLIAFSPRLCIGTDSNCEVYINIIKIIIISTSHLQNFAVCCNWVTCIAMPNSRLISITGYCNEGGKFPTRVLCNNTQFPGNTRNPSTVLSLQRVLQMLIVVLYS